MQPLRSCPSRLAAMAALALVAASAVPGPASANPPKIWAHAARPYIPDDPGVSSRASGWMDSQWNFVGPFGVGAPAAWGHLRAAHRAGGRGVTVAVLDTGVASVETERHRRSPDLADTRFARGRDFIDGSLPATDGNGHGTHVASTIAESTNNGYGMTGLAYGATIMPVRLLDDQGLAEARTVARAIRFAADHGAQVINLSLSFPAGTTAKDIPYVLSALRHAERAGALVVVAAGNGGRDEVQWPGVSGIALVVGATTQRGCLAAYSNSGSGLDIVAPGGGADRALDGDPNCQPAGARGLGVMQVTLRRHAASSAGQLKSRRAFGVGTFSGTSMAAPHVAATAALVIASGVLGPHPTPGAVRQRLLNTARDLGQPGRDDRYGAGLLDAAAATARIR